MLDELSAMLTEVPCIILSLMFAELLIERVELTIASCIMQPAPVDSIQLVLLCVKVICPPLKVIGWALVPIACNVPFTSM